MKTASAGTPSDMSIASFHASPCPQCGARMGLARRAPDPKLGLPAEVRTYDCVSCGKEISETVSDTRVLLNSA